MKPLPKTLPTESFEKQFHIQLGRFQGATDAWTRLVREGCDPLIFLMQLEWYCSHVPVKDRNKLHYSGYIHKFLKQKDSLAANAEKLAKRLMQDADEIEIINLDPEFAQQLTWFTKGRKFNLTHELRSYSSWLKSAGGIIGGSFSERDIPGQSIRFLADWIRSVFGKDRFGDLAELVQVGYAACGTDKDVDADAVRKLVTRARQRMRKRINENPVKASYPELRRP